MAFDPSRFAEPPATAAWRHRGARTGFEVVYIRRVADGYAIEGHVAAVEAGRTWAVEYRIRVDAEWATRSADVSSRSVSGTRSSMLRQRSAGRWAVNGMMVPELDGCRDVDLEASAFTNALPVHRMGLNPGARAEAPAAYVRAEDCAVGRLEQIYGRSADNAQRYGYSAPAFEFSCELAYDEFGLLLDYPGIAVREV